MGKVKKPPPRPTGSFWVDPSKDIDDQSALTLARGATVATAIRAHEDSLARGQGRTVAARKRVAAMQPQFDFLVTAAAILLAGNAPKQIPSLVGSLWFQGDAPAAKHFATLRQRHQPAPLEPHQHAALEDLRVKGHFDSAADLRARRDLREDLATIYAMTAAPRRR